MGDWIEGSCVCGDVRYRARGPFRVFQYCHCSRCRKASGSAFATNLFVDVGQLEWRGGENDRKRFDLPDAKYWSHEFCARCGSSTPWLTRTGKAYVIPAGTLDQAPDLAPSRNIYFGSKAPFYVSPHELETFDTFPKKT